MIPFEFWLGNNYSPILANYMHHQVTIHPTTLKQRSASLRSFSSHQQTNSNINTPQSSRHESNIDISGGLCVPAPFLHQCSGGGMLLHGRLSKVDQQLFEMLLPRWLQVWMDWRGLHLRHWIGKHTPSTECYHFFFFFFLEWKPRQFLLWH